MSSQTTPRKRWMTSVLKTAASGTPNLPFQRGQRKSAAERAATFHPRQRILRSA
jgi:hypothetical protein